MARLGSGGDVSITIRALNEAKKGINDAEKDLKGLEKSSTSTAQKMQSQWSQVKSHWLAITASIAGGLYTLKKAMDFAEEAAKFQQAERAFDNLSLAHGVAAGSMIEDLRKMSAQTISTAKLMQSAGTAMTLGIPAERLSEMMEIARASSRITGQSVKKSFEDIALGVGRQSKLILDNLGILVDVDKAYREFAETAKKNVSQLSEAEKKQAFINAAMKQGGQIVRDIGIDGLTAAEKMERFRAKMEDTAIALGAKLLPLFEKGLDIIDRLMGGPPEVSDALSRLGEMRYQLEDLYDTRQKFIEQAKRSAAFLSENRDPLMQLIIDKTIGPAEKTAFATYVKDIDSFSAGIVKLEKEIGNLQQAYIKAHTDVPADGGPKELSKEYLQLEETLRAVAIETARLGASRDELMAIDALEVIRLGAANEQLARYNQLLLERQQVEDALTASKEKRKAIEELISLRSDSPYGAQAQLEEAARYDELAKIQLQLDTKLYMFEDYNTRVLQAMVTAGQSRAEIEAAYANLSIQTEQQMAEAKLRINAQAANQKVQIEKNINQTILAAQFNAANQSIALLNIVGQKHKALGLAALVFQKGLAMAQVWIQTQVAASAALAPPPLGLGPIFGAPLAASIQMWGKIQMGLIAATGLAEAAFGGGGPSGVGGGGGVGALPIGAPAAQTAPAEPERASRNITIIVQGNVVDHAAFVRELAPYIDEAKGDKVNFGG